VTLNWVFTLRENAAPLTFSLLLQPLVFVVLIMCVAVVVYSIKNRNGQNLEKFSKIWVNKHGLRGLSKAEKRMLERKAISSFGKGMLTMFTRVSSWRISMSRHVAKDL